MTIHEYIRSSGCTFTYTPCEWCQAHSKEVISTFPLLLITLLRSINSQGLEFFDRGISVAHIRRIHPPSWLLQFLLTVINEENIVVRHCWSLRVFSVQDQCQIHLAFFTHLGLVRWEIFRWICNAFSCRFDKTTGFLVFQLWPGDIILQTIEVTKQGFLILNVSINADSCFVFRKT